MTNDKKLKMRTSPHTVSNLNTTRIMGDVLIALLPAVICGVYFFGFYVLTVIATTMLACVATEYLYYYLRKKQTTVKDLSAAVTGLILALNLPPQIPLYICAIGGFFAIFFVKLLFGGLGKNFANPAATARVFLMLAYVKVMTNFDVGNAFTGATYLPAGSDALQQTFLGLKGTAAINLQLFLGKMAGTIGETSKAAILIGFVYLLVRRVVDYIIPLCVLLSAAFFTLVFSGDVAMILPQLLSGGLIFGAVFMATDYSTSPMTKQAKILFAIGIGAISMLIRFYSQSYSEGVSFAIIFMNMFVPFMDKHMLPIRYGQNKRSISTIIALSLVTIMVLFIIVFSAIKLPAKKSSANYNFAAQQEVQL